MQLSDGDRAKISAAITEAEGSTAGEIVTVATPISDSYHDVALHWALIPLFAVLAWAAWRPSALIWWYDFLFGGWSPDPTLSELLTLAMLFRMPVRRAPIRSVSTPSTSRSIAPPSKGTATIRPF